MARAKKPRTFGHGFDLMLRQCEKAEDFFLGRGGRMPEWMVNVDLIRCEDEHDPRYRKSFQLYHLDMADNAARLRNSFKFKFDWGAIQEGDPYVVAEQVTSTPLYPPFEQCFVLLENWVADADMMLLVDTRTADQAWEQDTAEPEIARSYREYGIMPGDKFVSVMPTIYRHGIGVSFLPVELHYRMGGTIQEGNMGIPACPSFAQPTEAFSGGEHPLRLQLSAALYYVLYLLSTHETVRIPGLSPRINRSGAARGKRPFYEHHVVDLHPFEVKQVFEKSNPDNHRSSPRLHAVRGFWRHYKEPIKTGPNAGKTVVWIEPQWRGDKDKGVVIKDYNVITDGSNNRAI